MNTKNRILELLEKNRGKSLSGEELAKTLGVSRNAVWKNINSLKEEGHSIKAVSNMGYTLLEDSNILTVESIRPFLLNEVWADKIYVFKELESTNTTAKEMAYKDCEHGAVVIADHQTGARGRRGKSFHCLPGGGIYMSIILYAKSLNINIDLITPAAAIAVCKAIQKVTGQNPEIKWINDIILNNKKVCGILTESIVTDFTSGRNIDWVTIGIGINVRVSFPDELEQIAGSIIPERMSPGIIRNRISAEIINAFLAPSLWLNDDDIYSEYKSRLTMLGKLIYVIETGETYKARAVDIDKNCHLLVEKADGTMVSLLSGEVSTRRI